MSRIITDSPEDQAWWHERRRLGSADASSIMSVDKWSTPYSTWEMKTYRKQRTPMNQWMQKGIDEEPKARQEAEFEIGAEFPATNMVSDDYDFLVAAFDGWNDELKEGIEIKTAGKEDHALAKAGLVPPHYQPRLDHLLLVSGGRRIGYVSYNPDEGVIIVWYDRNEKRIKELLEKELAFWKCVIEDIPPSLTLRDFVVREDEEWSKYALEFKHWDAIIEQAEKHKNEAQQKLIEMANGQSTLGSGVKLLTYKKKGSIQYKKAVNELCDVMGEIIDLEQFRGEEQIITKVSCM